MTGQGTHFYVSVKQLTEEHATPIIMISNNYMIELLKRLGKKKPTLGQKVIGDKGLRKASFYI